MSRERKTAQQRAKRAAAAVAAGRQPHVSGRPATGRQATKCHGDRAGQHARRRERQLRAAGELGHSVTAHPIMDEAMVVASRYVCRPGGAVLHWTLWEDAVMVAALAICQGDDPHAVTAAYVAGERTWLDITRHLIIDGPQSRPARAAYVAMGRRNHRPHPQLTIEGEPDMCAECGDPIKPVYNSQSGRWYWRHMRRS